MADRHQAAGDRLADGARDANPWSGGKAGQDDGLRDDRWTSSAWEEEIGKRLGRGRPGDRLIHVEHLVLAGLWLASMGLALWRLLG